MTDFKRLLALGATLALCSCGGGGGSFSGLFNTPTKSNPPAIGFTTNYIPVPNVPVPIAPAPPGPYWSIDVGIVDQAAGIYYLADKTNCGVDVFDAKANAFITTIGPKTSPATFLTVNGTCASIGSPFSGNTGKGSGSGPNGLVLIGATKLYAGDGNGTIKIIDRSKRTITGTITIPGAKFRTDEGSYDADDNVVMIASDSEASPILTFINTITDTVIAQTIRSDATGGMEASEYDSQLHKFVQAVPVTNANKNGEIDLIDPLTQAVTTVYPLPVACGPTGISIAPNQHMVIACGTVANTLVMDVTSGTILATINQAGGGDVTSYDATIDKFFVANSNNTSTGVKGGPLLPVTSVIDGTTSFFIQNLPSEAHAHSVATYQGKAFVPLPSKGIAVYQ
jgi:hypothetical protein